MVVKGYQIAYVYEFLLSINIFSHNLLVMVPLVSYCQESHYFWWCMMASSEVGIEPCTHLGNACDTDMHKGLIGVVQDRVERNIVKIKPT